MRPNFGIPDERANPADSGKIIRAPSAGKAFFQAPFAVYMPTPGFAGTDSFEYEASAAGRGGAPLRLVVRVTIEVSAP